MLQTDGFNGKLIKNVKPKKKKKLVRAPWWTKYVIANNLHTHFYIYRYVLQFFVTSQLTYVLIQYIYRPIVSAVQFISQALIPAMLFDTVILYSRCMHIRITLKHYKVVFLLSDVNIHCFICCIACCKTAQTLVLHQKMEVQDQESLGMWNGLGSRDAISRTEVMESIRQDVMRKVEAIRPIPSLAPSPPASGSPPNSDLNDTLAHLLMLSKRCPFDDVKERCVRLLRGVQVGDSYSS